MTDNQQAAGPVDAPAEPVSTQQALRDHLFPAEEAADDVPRDSEEPQEEEQVSEEPSDAEPQEGELDEGDFEDGLEEGDEPQEAAIDAPYGYNAEEKDWFATLGDSDQQRLSAIEARRNADVTKVTQKAADAKRAAEAQAAQAAIEAKKNYATQLGEFVKNFEPAVPNPNLAYSNPNEYMVQKAQYDAQIGQFNDLKSQIEAIGEEAEAEDQRAFIEARDKALLQIPEIANEETRQDYLDRVFDDGLVTALGYERSELAQIADADDVKRLNTIAGWREKAEKYDKAMSRKMKRVRQGKTRTTKPGTVKEATSRQRDLQEAKARQRATGGREGTKEALRALLVPNTG